MGFGESRDKAKVKPVHRLGRRRRFFELLSLLYDRMGLVPGRPMVVGPPLSGLKQWQLAERGRWRGHRHGRESPRCRHGLKKATTPTPHTPARQSRLAAQPRAILDLGNSSPIDRSGKGKPAENRQESGNCHVQPCLRDPVPPWSPRCRPRLQRCLALIITGTINCQVIVLWGAYYWRHQLPGDCILDLRGMCRTGNRGESGPVFQYDSCPPSFRFPGCKSRACQRPPLQTARRPSSGRPAARETRVCQTAARPDHGRPAGRAMRCDAVRVCVEEMRRRA